MNGTRLVQDVLSSVVALGVKSSLLVFFTLILRAAAPTNVAKLSALWRIPGNEDRRHCQNSDRTSPALTSKYSQHIDRVWIVEMSRVCAGFCFWGLERCGHRVSPSVLADPNAGSGTFDPGQYDGELHQHLSAGGDTGTVEGTGKTPLRHNYRQGGLRYPKKPFYISSSCVRACR